MSVSVRMCSVFYVNKAGRAIGIVYILSYWTFQLVSTADLYLEGLWFKFQPSASSCLLHHLPVITF